MENDHHEATNNYRNSGIYIYIYIRKYDRKPKSFGWLIGCSPISKVAANWDSSSQGWVFAGYTQNTWVNESIKKFVVGLTCHAGHMPGAELRAFPC